MWLITLVVLGPPALMWLVVVVGFTQCFGPGPLRRCGQRRFPWLTRLSPFNRGDVRLARRVTLRLRALERVPWARQRLLYWRVRRFPDPEFRRSVWSSAAITVLIGVVGYSAVIGCGRTVLRDVFIDDVPRALRDTWIDYLIVLQGLVYVIPGILAVLAGVAAQRASIREAVVRYVTNRPKTCERCRYPLDESAAKDHALRCPECGLRHDLRVRGLPKAPTPERIRPAEDGPTLCGVKRAARLTSGVNIPGVHDAAGHARFVDFALMRARYEIRFSRFATAALAIGLAVVVSRALWPWVVGVMGDTRQPVSWWAQAVSMGIAGLGPIQGLLVWLWLDGRMLRAVVKRAARRRIARHRCPRCRYDLGGLAPDGNGLVTCPECGHESLPEGTEPRVISEPRL